MKDKNLAKELKEEKKQDEKVKETYLDDLKRVQAEFENYMKRVEKERLNIIDFAKQGLLLKILNTHDDFERALEVIKKTDNKDEIIKGVEMIFKQMSKLLEEEKVKVINALGEIPDPYKHDVIATVDGEDNKIVEEVKRGYMFKDKILRPSMVKIGKAKSGDVKNE